MYALTDLLKAPSAHREVKLLSGGPTAHTEVNLESCLISFVLSLALLFYEAVQLSEPHNFSQRGVSIIAVEE